MGSTELGVSSTSHTGPAAWSIKAILRLMVTSATYQQSSALQPPSGSPSPPLAHSPTRISHLVSRITDRASRTAQDPENRWLARGPRFRLQAELVRDNALAISGLLDRDRPPGGPSVKPYQPGDLWRELSAGDQAEKSYVQDHGPDLYRRGLYTFWKRSVLYPSFAVFDAPKREVCTVRRPLTNTPLQAFVTLNDPTYVEAARVFAQRILQEGGASFEARLDYALRRALGRPSTAHERDVLGQLYRKTLAKYRQDPKAALQLASAGEWPRPKELDPAEHAAWTCVCNAVLNLDETLTKE